MTRWTAEADPSVLDLARARAEAEPDLPFLTVVGRPLTPAHLLDGAAAVAGHLQDLSVVAGDRVALFTENNVETVVALFSLLHAGTIAVPINSAYKGRFLHHVLADSGAEVVICDPGLAGRLADALVESGTASVRTVLLTGDAGDASTALSDIGIRVTSWAEAMTGDRVDAHRGRDRDPAICLYTGGTTGPSKGCLLSQNALVHHALGPARAYRRSADDVLWTPLPLFHLNAIKFGVVGALASGGRSVISDRFSVSRFWIQLQESGATIANLLGSMATLVARAEVEPLDDRVRLIVAVPIPEDARIALEQRFGVETFSGMYGMTECSTIALLPDGVPFRPGAAGLVNRDDYEVRILDDSGEEVDPGQPGEIVVRPRRGNVMFGGYWNRPDATLAAFEDLWFHTGDIGRVDEDGYLHFVDRKGDYIRRRGENISTQEVEAVLREHPGILEVAVHAVPSPVSEDDLKITAIAKDPALTPEAFFTWMEPRLPFFALPAYIEFRDELPRSPVGRVLKRELRDEGITPATWSSEEAMRQVVRR